MFRKIASALLATVLLCGCSSAVKEPPTLDEAHHAAALEAFWGDSAAIPDTPAEQFTFLSNDTLGGIEIINYTGDENEVRVPSEIDGKPVVKVNLRGCYKNIKALSLPDSVRDVRLAAYDDMVSHYKDTNLTPDTHLSYYYVSEIGGCVVSNYYGGRDIVRIPDQLVNPENRSEQWTVKRIKLADCTKDISLLIIPDTVELVDVKPDYVTATASELKTLIEENLPDVSERRGRYSGMGVEKMNIPASLYQDRPITFSGTTLTEVFLPETFPEVPEALFSGCPLLARAVFGAEQVTVGAHAFFGCESLTYADTSKACFIGNWAFAGCTALTEIPLGDALTGIGDGAFRQCDSLAAIHIPASVENIGKDVFAECSALASITVDENNPRFSNTDSIFNR